MVANRDRIYRLTLFPGAIDTAPFFGIEPAIVKLESGKNFVCNCLH